MPVISWMLTTFLVPSAIRAVWMMTLIAELIYLRKNSAGISRPAMATIVSTRMRASLGELE